MLTFFDAFESEALSFNILNEPRHNKTNKFACVSGEDSDRAVRPPNLIGHCCSIDG